MKNFPNCSPSLRVENWIYFNGIYLQHASVRFKKYQILSFGYQKTEAKRWHIWYFSFELNSWNQIDTRTKTFQFSLCLLVNFWCITHVMGSFMVSFVTSTTSTSLSIYTSFIDCMKRFLSPKRFHMRHISLELILKFYNVTCLVTSF